jgi:hypothetical protein
MKFVRFAALALLIAATPALAGNDNDPGYKILHDYVLTLPRLKAYDAAYGALTTAAKTDAALKADLAAASGENDQTVAATVGKMDHHPRVYAFFQKQGLSKAEASLIPIILMNACMGVQYPAVLAKMGNMVAAGQVDFCKTNMAAVKQLHFFGGH